MKPKLRLALNVLILTAISGVVGFDYPGEPAKNYFAAALWRDRDVITINAAKGLTEDAIIKADELIINDVLYTNGHALKVDVIQLTFGPNGAIKGYAEEAAPEPKIDKGSHGGIGDYPGGTGGNGKPPKNGVKGSDGDDHPSSIVIYAARVVGNAVIDGTGQTGGAGADGAEGGDGGTGGRGENGQATCWGYRRDGKKGGRGGQAAPGGNGGTGGRGGAPIPVLFFTGQAPSTPATLISQPGKGGRLGIAGKPGKRGDGGPGGSEGHAGCWLYTVGSNGGAPGDPGPEQTQQGNPGEVGPIGPALDKNIEPLPIFANLIKSQSPGVISKDLKELEGARLELVDGWSQFHWARTFYFLTLDTLTELQSAPSPLALDKVDLETDADALLTSIQQNGDADRIHRLLDLWVANLPPDSGVALKVPMVDARATAQKVIDFLQQLLIDPSQTKDLKALLSAVSSGMNAQLDSALDTALESCRKYNELRGSEISQVLSLTTQYSVPVCEKHPDFSLASNVDKPVVLFIKTAANIPADLNAPTYYKRVALNDVNQWLRFVSNQATAAGFVIVDTDTTKATPKDIQNRLPPRKQWVVDDIGVFTGFPQVEQAKSIVDVGNRLFYLQQILIRMRNR